MRRLLKLSGFILVLFIFLSIEVADQSSSSLFTTSEAEAGRRRLFNRAAEAQPTTQGSNTESETVSDEVSDEDSAPPAHRRSRHKGTSSASTGGTTRAKSSQEGSPSTVPIGTVVQTLPKGCQSTVFKGVSYSNCGGTYYRAAFQGSNLVYVSVDKPQ